MLNASEVEPFRYPNRSRYKEHKFEHGTRDFDRWHEIEYRHNGESSPRTWYRLSDTPWPMLAKVLWRFYVQTWDDEDRQRLGYVNYHDSRPGREGFCYTIHPRRVCLWTPAPATIEDAKRFLEEIRLETGHL